MKRKVLWLLCVLSVLFLHTLPTLAQIPATWVLYTNSSKYLHEIRSDINNAKQAESVFCETLRQSTIVGLALQIEANVNSGSKIDKSSVDGRSHTSYSSTSTLYTNVDLQLVNTDVQYNRATGEGVAIAWIDKQEARQHYANEVRSRYAAAESAIALADGYAADGYTRRATSELEECLPQLDRCADFVSRLSLFGASQETVSTLSTKENALRGDIYARLKEWRHSLTLCIECRALLFDGKFVGLGDKLKGGVAAEGCSFAPKPDGADWYVVVDAAAREYATKNVGGTIIYTAYVDATISITNISTGQQVCVDEVTAKGTHTFNYKEAACDAYKEIIPLLLETINSYIN